MPEGESYAQPQLVGCRPVLGLEPDAGRCPPSSSASAQSVFGRGFARVVTHHHLARALGPVHDQRRVDGAGLFLRHAQTPRHIALRRHPLFFELHPRCAAHKVSSATKIITPEGIAIQTMNQQCVRKKHPAPVRLDNRPDGGPLPGNDSKPAGFYRPSNTSASSCKITSGNRGADYILFP